MLNISWRVTRYNGPICLSYNNDVKINKIGIKDRLDE